MSRTKQTRNKQQTPQAMARQAVERYFAQLTHDVPSDSGDVNLIDAAVEIERAIMRGRRYKEDRASAAGLAGYLVGVEVGRRLGPASMKGGA